MTFAISYDGSYSYFKFFLGIIKIKIEDGRIRLRIELENWFLRLFTPYVEAAYDIETRQLLTYQGISFVADASGKTVPVTVSYDYSQQNLLASFRNKPESAGLAPN